MKSARYVFLLSTLLLASGAAQAAETYTLDSSHTNVVWRISHFGFSHPDGKITKVEGTLVLDQAAPEKSKVTVKFSPANLLTGVEKLDEHLKSPDFFDAGKFPDASYVSDQVSMTGKDTAKVSGILTLHGVSKPVVLDVKLNKIDKNMMGKMTAGFSATTTLKRSDFGITKYLPNLGDEVDITIESEANIQ